MRRVAFIALASGVLAFAALAAGDVRAQSEMDDVLEGFDDEDVEPLPARSDATSADPRFWDLTGAVTLGSSYAYARDESPPGLPDYRGLARLQAQLSLQLDLELPAGWQARVAGRGFRDWFYAIEGRSRFPNGALDVHERELEFQELWLRGSPQSWLDVKVGRQIVNWGRSDNLRVLDVLNPLDVREPGLVDVEDLRLPLAMTRLDVFRRPWRLTGIAVHENRFDTAPVPGSDFFPAGLPALPERNPANGGDDTEWAAALTGIFSGWDVSLHWARFWNDTPHGEGVGPFPSRLEHARLTLYGASAQVARGNFLWKTEIAYLRGLRFFEPAPRDRSRVDVMAGVEYSGWTDASATIEVVNRHLGGFDGRLETPLVRERRNRLEGSARYSADFWNQTLHFTVIALVFGAHAQDGALIRAQLAYDVRDAFTVTGGVVFYEEGDFLPFAAFDHHDRLFLSAKYAF